MLFVETIHDPEDWASHRDDWNRLSQKHLTRSYEWLRAWWDAYHSDYRLSILKASRDGEPVSFFPLARRKALIHGETLCFLGSGKACSDNIGILVESQNSKEAVEAFADALSGLHSASSPSGHSSVQAWDHIDLDGVRTNDSVMLQWLDALHENIGERSERRASLNCWRVDIADGWDAYLASLSKRVRKMWNDTQRYLVADSTFRVAQGREETLEYLEIIAGLHQHRWEERGIVGCFGTEHFEGFLLNLIAQFEGLESQGYRSFVSLVKIHGEPASGMIGFVYDQVLYVYLTGMSPNFLEYRPGWHTSFCSIREATAMGCKGIDFMRGDEDYKPRLGAQPHAQERWIVSAPRLTSQLRNKAYYAAIGIRDLLK